MDRMPQRSPAGIPPIFGWTVPLAAGRTLEIRRPLVMGILNATPDSFSDGGRLDSEHATEAAVAAMLAAGADILDVGGESTRPGHIPVAADEEARRVIPVIRAIRRQSATIPISIDTRKAEVARLAVGAGASFVNDVSGLADAAMAPLVRDAGCAIVLMRNQALHGDMVAACRNELAALVATARAADLRDEQIILDPGLGFGDPPGGDPVANFALLRGIRSYAMERPVLVGASRKRFVGARAEGTVSQERVTASVAAAVEAVRAGAAIVRVHDVAVTVQALRGLAAPSRQLASSGG